MGKSSKAVKIPKILLSILQVTGADGAKKFILIHRRAGVYTRYGAFESILLPDTLSDLRTNSPQPRIKRVELVRVCNQNKVLPNLYHLARKQGMYPISSLRAKVHAVVDTLPFGIPTILRQHRAVCPYWILQPNQPANIWAEIFRAVLFFQKSPNA
ncbi:hypothetical protein AGMMS49975_26230 [Clostridia bacterium]|nr:hypothetical protein AGMMS49975_26230 [Clostridia bacterium]